MATTPSSETPAHLTGSPTTPQQRRRAFRLLFLCLITSGMGNGMLFALMPPLARDIGLPEIAVGAVYSISAVLFTIMSQVWGAVSDRIGRKPVVLIGLVGYAASTLVFAQVMALALAGVLGATTAGVLLVVARALFGAIGSAGGPAAQAYVADRTTPAERTGAVAGLTSAFPLGAMIGPAFAGLTAPTLGYVTPLVITAALSIAGALAVRAMLPERTPPRDRDRPGVFSSFAMVGDPRLTAILVVGVLTWIAQAAHLQMGAFFIIDRLGVSLEAATLKAGIMLSVGAAAVLLAQGVIVPRLKLKPRTALVVGAAIMAGGMAFMIVAGTYLAAVIGFATTAFGFGLNRPGVGAAASLAVEPPEQGRAAGLAAASAGVGFLVGPLTGLGVYQLVNPATAYGLGAAMAAASCALAFVSPAVRRASRRAV